MRESYLEKLREEKVVGLIKDWMEREREKGKFIHEVKFEVIKRPIFLAVTLS